MKLLTGIFVLAMLVGCAKPRHIGASDPIIDTTSWDTISKSIATAKPEDFQIVGEIPCDLGHKLGLDPRVPEQRELLLKQLRIQFQGKTVAQVAAEVRAQRKSESDKLQQFADDYVREHRQRWKGRAEHVSSVTKGTKAEDVLNWFGKPDGESGTGATKSLLYWIDVSAKDGQICKEMIVLKIESDVVASVQQTIGYRRPIDEVYKESHE